MEVLMADAGMLIERFVATVIRPVASITICGTVLADPYVPVATPVVERENVLVAEPLNDVPARPVPAVSEYGVLAVTVPDPAKGMVVPLIVTPFVVI
jgi:hypothetical protein